MRNTAAVWLLLLLTPAAARGQAPAGPVSRADVAVSTGWFAADRSLEADCCSSHWSAGLFKGVAAGIYWTDHLKTEAAVASPGVTEAYTVRTERLANGSNRFTYEEHQLDGTKFSIAQIYQFGRNSTFHPFVVGGVDVDRERDTIEGSVSTSSSTSVDRRVETSIRTRAFAGAGFKAYFSERAFFKGEARFAAGRHGDQMTWTAGVGVDLGGHRDQPATVEATSGAVPRGQEPAVVWLDLTSRLKTGSLLDVTPAGSDRFVGRFVAGDADGILVKPATRVPEPVRHIAFDRLEWLALHDGPRPGSRVGATLAGVGAGAGTFTLVLMMLLSHIGG